MAESKLKTFTVYRRFAVEVSRVFSAETMAEAEQKALALPTARFIRQAPGADLCDWENLSGTSVHEERE